MTKRLSGDNRPVVPTELVLAVGMTCFWPFLTIGVQLHRWFHASVFFAFTRIESSVTLDYSIALAACFCVLFAVRGRLAGAGAGAARRRASVAAGAAGAVALAVFALPGSAGVAVPHWIVGLAVLALAAFVAFSLVAWGMALEQLPTRRAVGLILGTCAASRLLFFACFALRLNQAAVDAAFALACGLFLAALPAGGGPRGTLERPALRDVPWQVVAPALVLSLVISVIAQGLVGYGLASAGLGMHAANLALVCAVCAGLWLWLRDRASDLFALVVAFAGFFMLCCGVLFATYAAPGFPDLTIALRVCLVAVLWVVFAFSARYRHLGACLIYPIFGVFGVAMLGLRMFDHAGLLALLASDAVAGMVAASVAFVAAVGSAVAAVVVAHRHTVEGAGERSAADVAMPSEGAVSVGPGAAPGTSLGLAGVGSSGVDGSAGASGALGAALGTAEARLARAVRNAGLTPRELDVVRLAARGYTAKRIGEELFVSENTVKTHLAGAYRKLGVGGKQELIDYLESYR